MGSKRKRSKQNPGPSSSAHHSRVWPDDAVDELLSYLNSQVAILDPATETQKELDFDDIEQELARHLNNLRDDGKFSLQQLPNYSPQRIRAKLRRLYTKRKQIEDKTNDWAIIYTQGFACLDWKDDSERQARMILRSKEIRQTWKWGFLHSPRRTRAGPLVNSSTPNSPQRDIRETSSTSNLRSRIERSRVAGSQPLRQKPAIDEVQHVSDTESSAANDGENIINTIENVTQEPSAELISEHDQIQPAPSLLRDSQELSDPGLEAFGTPLRSFSPVGDGSAAPDRTVERSPSILRLKKRLHDTEKERRDAVLEKDFWKAEYCKAQDARSRFQKSITALIAKQNLDRGSEFSVGEHFVKREALINELLFKLDSQKRVQDLMPDTDTVPDDVTISRVSELMQDINGRLQAILKDAKLTSVPELRELPEDHLLRSLAEQAFGVEWDSPEAMELLERWREGPCLHQFGLLALCGAALARWVFQQTQADIFFDRSQDVGTRKSTNRYRDAIELVGQRDPAFARAIDLIVHKRLADEDGFEDFRKEKGRNLARKLQEALAPLCQLDPDTEEQSDADSECDGYAVGQLSRVFLNAIDVQCRLVLTGWRYECTWHEPGAPFDQTCMSPRSEQKVSAADTTTVRLTLLPGIDQVRAGRIGVDLSGFAERRHRDHEAAVCLVRAVVQCGNADLH